MVHFSSFIRVWRVTVLIAQLCLTFCEPMDWSPPGSSVYGICRQEYCCGLPIPSPGDLLNPGIKPRPPALLAKSLSPELPGCNWQIKLYTFKLHNISQMILTYKQDRKEANYKTYLSCTFITWTYIQFYQYYRLNWFFFLVLQNHTDGKKAHLRCHKNLNFSNHSAPRLKITLSMMGFFLCLGFT